MAVVGKLYRLTWGGSLYGVDQWANSVHIHSVGALASNPSAYSAALSAFHIGNNHSKANLDYIKFNEINPLTGKYASLVDSFTFTLAPTVPGAMSLAYPQLSAAMTLRSVKARGRGSVGRIYPCNGSLITGIDGRIEQANVTAQLGTFRTLINAINTASGGGNVVIFSRIAQTVDSVIKVGMGRVMDNQQRRRKSLNESATVITLA